MLDNLALYQNSSIAAIQLAIGGVILVKWFALTKNQLLRLVIVLFLAAILFAIILLQSRTADLAFALGILYVVYSFLRSRFSKNKIAFIAGTIFAISLFIMSVLVKVESSAGRLFIWQNCLRLLKDNWFTGVGFGKFNPNYNHGQAQYFSNHSLISGEALRADDGYYAFNEWLHIWIETGIAGFLIFLAITVLAISICLKNVHNQKQWYGAILIPLITACLFSYPLHNWLLLTIGILFTCICFIDYFSNLMSREKLSEEFSWFLF